MTQQSALEFDTPQIAETEELFAEYVSDCLIDHQKSKK